MFEADLLLATLRLASPVNAPGAKLIPPAPATPLANFELQLKSGASLAYHWWGN